MLIGSSNGRIAIVLTKTALYCANEGTPIDGDGIDAILNSHISLKRGSEIGRFGLGFKSVLGVCSAPQFFSRSASFGFDADLAAKQILSIVPDAQRLPTLRISWPLDAQAAAASDSVLAELMAWATTVVKLPLNSSSTGWLHEDLRQFPAEFLLFSSHVGTLTFEDRTDGYARSITLRNLEDGRIELKEGESTSIWKVFHKQHIPSKAARADAGELADRELLPLAWAVPMQGRNARGRFWAFFPTEYFTTLSGIVNAPWKTNEDRQNLLTGVFNEELIDEIAKIIAIKLPELMVGNDPGRYLDLLPARGREAPNWADELITERVYYYASGLASLPDQNGVLQLPGHLNLHPGTLTGRPGNMVQITVAPS